MKKGVESFVQDVEKEFEIEIKNVPITVASFSKKILKSFYGVDYSLKNNEINEDFRQFYFGGRTEVFDFNIWKNVKDYDINSLYPFIMHKEIFPYELRGFETEKTFDEIKETDYICIEALVYENSSIPLLPERIEGKLMFRNGVKRCLVFKEEIEHLSQFGVGHFQIKKVLKVYYGKQDYLFKEYVEKNYKLRKRADKPFYNLIFKLILNSSYGKFAEKTEKEEIKMISREEITVEQMRECDQMIGNNFLFRGTKEVKLSLNVPLACKITALSRMELHKHMITTINSGGKLIYCDTDSIFCDGEYFEEHKELGAMKLERDLKKLVCLSAKEYSYDLVEGTGRIKMKGFTNEEGSVEKFLKSYLKPFYKTRKTTFKESLMKFNEDSEFFRFAEIRQKMKRTFYKKRVILDDGTKRPLTTEELPSEIEEQNKEKILSRFEKWMKN